MALSLPSSPTPGSTSVATTAAPGPTPAANAAGSAAANFLLLLAGLARATQRLPAAANALPASVDASLNLAELAEPAGPADSSSDDDNSDTRSDECSLDDAAALCLLALPALPLTMAAPLTHAETASPAEGNTTPSGSASSRTQTISETGAGVRDAVADLTSQLAATMASQDSPGGAADLAGTQDDTAASAAPAASTPSNAAPQASHLHSLAAAHALQDADPTPPREIRAPLGTPAWTQELGDELTWMLQQGLDAASLRLSPEHLGPLEIRISMREGEASVWFGAAHADTRSALEQSLPRLRELFASQGMVLADAGVFREGPRNQFKPGAFASGLERNELGRLEPVTRAVATPIRLLDTYA